MSIVVSRHKMERQRMHGFYSQELASRFSLVCFSYIPPPILSQLFGRLSLGLAIGLSIVITPRRDLTYLGPTYYVATAAVDRNSNSSAVFKMWFGAGSIFHGASGPFLYSNTTTLPSSLAVHPNSTLSTILVSYFISFALTMDPNILRAPGAPFWPSYASGGAGNVAKGESIGFTVLNITDTAITTSKDGDVSAQCDFWSSHGLDVGN
jgi:hypothetical protein